MEACPLSGTYSEIIRKNLIECFAVTSTFAAAEGVIAKILHQAPRVPIILGAFIPLSHYALCIIDHRTYTNEKTVHNSKHQGIRSMIITAASFLVIRSYRNTPHALPYKWGIISLLTAKFFANLGNRRKP